jgi:hypothetical protein
MRPYGIVLLATIVAAVTAGCEPTTENERLAPMFTDVAAALGVQFKIDNGATGDHFIVETMLGGVGWIDYDGDGDYDLYLANGHDNPGQAQRPGTQRNALYRNDGARFQDVTDAAGVAGRRYSHGVAVADYDNDGDSDLLVTNFGRNTLYRNRGDGTFEDVSESARLVETGYNTSAAWVDYDRDGDLDLYVTRYLEYWPAVARPCHRLDKRTYCHPRLFSGQPDLFYRNEGDGTFVEIGRQVGMGKFGDFEGKGLGVIAADFDRDGWTDLYVANDTTANFLWRNKGDETFEDVAYEWGVALSEEGIAQAGMGIDWGDVNDDGVPDIHVTNFAQETNNLFLSQSPGGYVDGVHETHLSDSFGLLGFGTLFVDVELDGDLDLVVANGHIDDLIETFSGSSGATYRQRPALYLNNGSGVFHRENRRAGHVFQAGRVGRGLASADFDNDGDTDLALVSIDQSVVILRQETPDRGHYVRVRLVGKKSPRDGYGARIEAKIGSLARHYEYQSARSYLSACDPRVIIGLGAATQIDALTVHWTSGHTQTVKNVKANQEITVVEGAP